MNFRTFRMKSLMVVTGICLSFLLASAATAAEYTSVKSDGVNIRSGPSTNDEVLWEVFQGFPLEIIKHDGKWAQCQDFEGDKGWIHSDLLSADKTVIVKKKMANLRAGAGTNYETVATVKYGVIFTAVEKDGDWLKVKHEDGTVGWIFNTLIWPSDPM
ncbi:MAG: SH3 domain-containing protein [Proteobacteria bacterium]|nr:SH3 domain-containing protein [Pseudomonadota bacterium]MBU1739701.1 SH3 domain-containing protein [Pseudomonadota bacterium]